MASDNPVGYEPIESGVIQKGDKVFNGDGRWMEIPMLVGQPIKAGGYAVIRPISALTAERDALAERVARSEKVIEAARSVWLFSRGYVSEGVEIPENTNDEAVEEEEAARSLKLYRAIEAFDTSPHGGRPMLEIEFHKGNSDTELVVTVVEDGEAVSSQRWTDRVKEVLNFDPEVKALLAERVRWTP